MKKVEIIINEDGSYEIGAMDGFIGQSCDQKTANIVSLLGGVEVDKKYKSEYYDSEGDNLNELINKR